MLNDPRMAKYKAQDEFPFAFHADSLSSPSPLGCTFPRIKIYKQDGMSKIMKTIEVLEVEPDKDLWIEAVLSFGTHTLTRNQLTTPCSPPDYSPSPTDPTANSTREVPYYVNLPATIISSPSGDTSTTSPSSTTSPQDSSNPLFPRLPTPPPKSGWFYSDHPCVLPHK